MRKIIGKLSFLTIPAGLIAWLFWPDGWKITVAGVIVFTTLAIQNAAKEYQDKHKQEETK